MQFSIDILYHYKVPAVKPLEPCLTFQTKNNDVFPLVEYAVKNHIPVGAICNAVNFMAENGFLNEIKHSGNTLKFMKSQAPHYKGDKNFLEEQAVCDAISTHICRLPVCISIEDKN